MLILCNMKGWLYAPRSLNNETIPSLAFYGPKLSSHKKGYDLQLHNYCALRCGLIKLIKHVVETCTVILLFAS